MQREYNRRYALCFWCARFNTDMFAVARNDVAHGLDLLRVRSRSVSHGNLPIALSTRRTVALRITVPQ